MTSWVLFPDSASNGTSTRFNLLRRLWKRTVPCLTQQSWKFGLTQITNSDRTTANNTSGGKSLPPFWITSSWKCCERWNRNSSRCVDWCFDTYHTLSVYWVPRLSIRRIDVFRWLPILPDNWWPTETECRPLDRRVWWSGGALLNSTSRFTVHKTLRRGARSSRFQWPRILYAGLSQWRTTGHGACWRSICAYTYYAISGRRLSNCHWIKASAEKPLRQNFNF